MANIVARQDHDLGAAVGQLNQQPIPRQHAESLAQRRARHAQLLAEFALVQLGAGRQHAFDDQDAQPLRRRFGQREPGNGDVGAVHWTQFRILYTKCNIADRRG
jgi:hypothetical protein